MADLHHTSSLASECLARAEECVALSHRVLAESNSAQITSDTVIAESRVLVAQSRLRLGDSRKDLGEYGSTWFMVAEIEPSDEAASVGGLVTQRTVVPVGA